MTEAMQCNGGIFRVEHEDGQVYIFANYAELTQHYDIIGVITNKMFLTFAVTKKAA